MRNRNRQIRIIAEPERVRKDRMKRTSKSNMWLTPLLLALPAFLGIGFAAVRYGRTVQNLIHVAIKLAVTR